MTNLAVLKGGWGGWLRAGYPVESSVTPTAAPAAAGTPGAGQVAVLGEPDAPVTIVEYSDFQ